MNKNVKGALTIAVVGAIAFGVYKLAFKTKRAYARAIFNKGKTTSYAGLLTMDEPYLKEWAKSAKIGAETFTYNGKTYNTMGGAAVRN